MRRPSSAVRWAGIASMLGGVVSLLGTVTPLQGSLRPLVPAGIVLMMVGAVGLYVILRRLDASLVHWGLGLAGVGLALGLIGMAGSALRVLDPNPVARIINTGEHAGLLFIGAGMIVWGVASVRTSALGRWSFVPVAIGILSLAGVSFLLPLPLAWLWRDVVPLIFYAAWIALGYAILTAAIVVPNRDLARGPHKKGSREGESAQTV